MKHSKKEHKSPKELGHGQVSIFLTARLQKDELFFISHEIVDPLIEILTGALNRNNCIAPVYCFLPEHLHTIIQGQTDDSNAYGAMIDFKQKSGSWIRQHHPTIRWRKIFFNHIIRKKGKLGAKIKYILENPVKLGLVEHWWEYPFSGAIGCDLQEILKSLRG